MHSRAAGPCLVLREAHLSVPAHGRQSTLGQSARPACGPVGHPEPVQVPAVGSGASWQLNIQK